MDKKSVIAKRFAKHTTFSLFGTATDTLVLWIFSHFILEGTYVGENVISPAISFECGNIVNFLISSCIVWPDRMKGKSRKSKYKHFLAYNLSYTSVFFLKMGLLQFFIWITRGWDVVVCNIFALMVAGIANFVINDLVIFKNKKVSLPR
ncbi:MAG: GtrA family protein [Bacteroidales bacterium]|nr:GtrA family protein [Bacteroidales bacterium]